MTVVITAARYPPIGSSLGTFADVPPVALGTTVAREVPAGVDGNDSPMDWWAM